MKNKFMQRAIDLSIESIRSGGGPFGSVIVKGEKIISEGMNRVTVNNDPTAHGEITAIRQACNLFFFYYLIIKMLNLTMQLYLESPFLLLFID